MSIRIDSDKLSGAAAAQTGQAEQTRSTGNRFSANAGLPITSSDSVQISSMAEGIADGNAVQSAQREARVGQLSAMYASGQYGIDSMQLSRRMVAGAIVGSEGAGG